MNGLSISTWLWAQSTSVPDETAVPLLSLRRWYTGLTLSSPEPIPSRWPIWTWLIGLAALLLVAMIAQGPGRALKQLFDLPGHLRLASMAVGRMRRAGRLGAMLLGATVLAWTVSQALTYNREDRKEDVAALLRTKSLSELAVEQGALAALTQLRDVAGSGDNLVLLVAAAVLVFKLSADRWGSFQPGIESRASAPGWTTLCWGGAWLYVLYRLASLVGESEGLPLGGCLFVEAALVPALMLLADAVVLSWVLVELRAAEPDAIGAEGFDVIGLVRRVPAAALACALALPARYVAAGTWLVVINVDRPVVRSALNFFTRNWGLTWLQGTSLVAVGLAGAAAWGRGSVDEALRGYGRILRHEGGRLVAVLAGGGALGGALAATSYALVLALPTQPWVLPAADSYAHYATLPVGLAVLSALVELGARVRPMVAPTPAPASVTSEERLDVAAV